MESKNLRDTLPPEQLPRERLKQHGPEKLSDVELLAILLRTGSKGNSVLQVASELIKQYRNFASLATRSIEDLKKIPGIGQDKAIMLKAVFEISTRIQKSRIYMDDVRISSPAEVAEFFIPMLQTKQREVFLIACLNAAHRITNYRTISEGILDASLVHAREVFKAAIEENAKAIILIHNHPSGNPDPSVQDVAVTKKLIEAGKIFDIAVLDHLIIAGNNFSSMVDRRLM